MHTNNPPNLTKLRGGLFPRFILNKNYIFWFYDTEGSVSHFTIPAGFEIDGATFGSFLFWRKSLHESAYTLAHDWIYKTSGDVKAVRVSDYRADIKQFNSTFSLTKTEGDDIFIQGARRQHNIQNWRAALASGILKTLGHIPWWFRRWKLIR